jgi:hypothetical protein
MDNCTYIFVEGDGDAKFISDYILHIEPNAKVEKNKKNFDVYIHNGNDKTLIAKIQSSGGYANIKNLKPNFIQYRDAGAKVLIIFDADTENNNGGFAKRKKEIEDYGLALDEIFLFPNNKDDGALEVLLENIINQTNEPIFDCWNKFEDCLQGCASKRIEKELTIPAKKSKIYVYLEALLGKTKEEKEKIKDPNREYRLKEHWDLDSKYLIPLRDFLEKYF